MQPGQLDTCVEILKRTTARSTKSGQPVETFVFDRDLLMKADDLKVSERMAGSQKQATLTTLFTARFEDAFDVRPESHRLQADGLVYEVHGRRERGRREWLEFQCQARAELEVVE